MNCKNIINKDYYDQSMILFECSIHRDLLVNPVLCQNLNCKNILCQQCADKLPKSSNYNPECPNCQESLGFTKTGTENIIANLENLSFSCVKCTQTHSYSAAANCTQKFCQSCMIYYNENKHHYCYKCWRCIKSFKTVDQFKWHLNECKPDEDQHFNTQLKNSISDIWIAFNNINNKVHFVFNYIMTILEKEKITDGFKTWNYESHEDKMRKFKSDIGYKSTEADFVRTELISELDIRVFFKDDSMGSTIAVIGKVRSCRPQLQNRERWVLARASHRPVNRIEEYGRQPRERRRGFASWIERMLQLVAKALPVPVAPEERYEIKQYREGTFEIQNGNIKKTSNNRYNSMVRLDKPLSEGVHEFKVRIDRTLENSCILIGLVDESSTDPSFKAFESKAIGISVSGSNFNCELNLHRKGKKAHNGDVIAIKVDFNRSIIDFYYNGSILADANVKKKGFKRLYLAIYIYYQGDAVTPLEFN